MYKFIPATEEHVEVVLANIAPDVRQELEALKPGPLDVLIKQLITRSDEAWAAFADDDIVCIFGVGCPSLLSGKAVPWLITTKLVGEHKKNFLKGAKISISYWLEKYNRLENYVPVGFNRLIKWVKWAGFTIDPAIPYGAEKKQMYRIWMEK